MKKNHFLLIALLNCFVFISCGKTIVDYLVKSEFRYINTTAHPVKINIYGNISGSPFNSYLIPPQDSLVLQATDQTHDKEAQPENYVPLLQGDSVEIIFVETLSYKEYRGRNAILNNISSYKINKIASRDYVFSYSIDSVLIKLAK